jgi:hypothetical protein
MSLPKRVMWKAVDGREFIIDTEVEKLNTQEDLINHIAGLRKKHGYEEPTFMSLSGPRAHELDSLHTDDLPEHLRQKVVDTIKEGLDRPDPKKAN